MTGRTIEKDGETYIVSENVKDLDTENLVDKDVVTKLLNGLKQVEQKPQKIRKKRHLSFATVCFEFEVYRKPVTVTAQLKKMQIRNKMVVYELLAAKPEAFELAKLFHGGDSSSLRNITLGDGESDTKIGYTRYNNLFGFEMQAYTSNTDLILCKVEMSAQ